MIEPADKTMWCLTAAELRTIEKIIKFFNAAFPVLNPGDFEILDADGAEIGKIVWNGDMDTFVFVPRIWETFDIGRE